VAGFVIRAKEKPDAKSAAEVVGEFGCSNYTSKSGG
jgi:hypothetical protein